MRTLNITFTDQQYLKLKRAKEQFAKTPKMSWHFFIIAKCCKGMRR